MTDGRTEGGRYPAEETLDTPQEQATALLRDLRESFSPTYLTLISIVEGVLLGLVFELISEGRPPISLHDPGVLIVIGNVLVIILVWNEYRMGASMFRWVPSLLDAIIPFTVGVIQAALILAVSAPRVWLGSLAAFYLAGIAAFENMYRRSAAEERNDFVLRQNQRYRRLNPLACLGMSVALFGLLGYHLAKDTQPGGGTLTIVLGLNVLFILRGEANWRHIVRVTRAMAVRGRVPA